MLALHSVSGRLFAKHEVLLALETELPFSFLAREEAEFKKGGFLRRSRTGLIIYSSMFAGTRNRKSGILVINLPSTECYDYTAAHVHEEKRLIYPEQNSWKDVSYRSEYEALYPDMPDRILDNLLAPKAYISVVPWQKLTIGNLEFLIEATFKDKVKCEYDLSRPMRRRNS